MDRDYELLVASHLLRDPGFAAVYGPLLSKVGGHFFGDFWIQDAVTYAMEYFSEKGVLLPKAALLTDVARFARDGTSFDNYKRALDEVFSIQPKDIHSSATHVMETFVRHAQAKAILALDWRRGATQSGVESLLSRTQEIACFDPSRNGSVISVSEGLLEALTAPPVGVPTGIPALDQDFHGGGVCQGETCLFFGPYASGKTTILLHCARHAASVGYRGLVWSFETSRRNTLLRLSKGLLGLTEEELRFSPKKARAQMSQIEGSQRLFVKYTPRGLVTMGQMGQAIDQVEQFIGEKLDFIVVDYSEKRAKGLDWQAVKEAYDDLRQLCGERGMAGFDAAQKNAEGRISFYGLLKDADIGIELTPGGKQKKVFKEGRWEEPSPQMINKNYIEAKIDRNREGPGGRIVPLDVDFSTGRVKEHVITALKEEEE